MPSWLLTNSYGVINHGTSGYVSPFGSGFSNSTESKAQLKARDAYTVSGLYLHVSTNNCGTATTWRFRNAGANGNQVVTIPANTTGAFQDTTHSDSVASGALYAEYFTNSSGSGSVTVDSHSALFTTTSDNTPILIGGLNGIGGVTAYLGISDTPYGGLAAETYKKYTFRTGSTLSNLMAYCSGATGTFQLRHNGANGNEVLTISGSGLAEDTSNTDVISAGDTVDFYESVTTFYQYSVMSTSTSFQRCSSQGGLYQNYGTTAYMEIGSIYAAIGTEANAQVLAQSAHQAQNAFVMVSPNTINSGNSTITLKTSSVGNTALVLTIPYGTSGVFEDTTDNVSIAATDLIDWAWVTSGTSGALALTILGYEWRQPGAAAPAAFSRGYIIS